ncbi:MAG: glycosyl hydrolase [Bacteroidota bacterium]
MNRRSFLVVGMNLTAGAAIAAGEGHLKPWFINDAGFLEKADLEGQFLNPPDSARPLTLWHWMNGIISEEGITADLESFKAAGLAGVQLFLVGGIEAVIDDPSVQIMNDKWRGLLKFAENECNRLGLEFGIHNSPGWSSTGYPSVALEDSMQKLTFLEMEVSGPQLMEKEIAQPPSARNFYQDIAAFACKKGSVVERAAMIDLTGMLSGNQLKWQVPEGDWTIIRVGHTTANKVNGTAPLSGQGLEVDKLDKKPLNDFWKVFPKALIKDADDNAGKSFRRFEIDSYEMGPQNWTRNMRAEFKKRRGYDPLPLLISFAGKTVDSTELTARFKYDYNETIRELFEANYYGEMQRLIHQVPGMELLLEPYATGHDQPFETNNAAEHGDLLMCEFWQKPTTWGWDSVKPTASGAHTWGKNLVAAEAFTGQPNSAWKVDPYALKSTGDRAFAAGVNKLFFHTSAHQPWKNVLPGMTMGQWGTHFGRTQTWWANGGKEWIAYLTRCQYLLQQGLPLSDLCYLEYDRITPKTVDGFDFDTIGTNALLTRLTVKDGQLQLPNDITYQALILPNTDKMRPEILAKIGQLVAAGAKVIGPKPQSSPSLQQYPACDERVRDQSEAIWGQDGTVEHAYGKGHVYTQPIEEAISKMGLVPDVELAFHSGTTPLLWIHRKLAMDKHVYFLSNQEEREVQSKVIFRIKGLQPEFWNAMDGTTEKAVFWREQSGRTEVTINLPASGSVFVVFREKIRHVDSVLKMVPPEGAAAFGPGIKTLNNNTYLFSPDNGTYEIAMVSGRSQNLKVTSVLPPIDLNLGWKVNFKYPYGGSAQLDLDRLVSWTELNDDLKYFSGTATYQNAFDIGENQRNPAMRCFLQLGRVLNTVRVRINGKVVHLLWAPPFHLDITDFIVAGENNLELDITNLWANRLIGDEQYPDDLEWKRRSLAVVPEWVKKGMPRLNSQRKAFTTYKFFAKDTPLLPSGLIGPVSLNFVWQQKIDLSK